MKRETLPIDQIQVIERQRQDLGDITGLANSLKQYSLIQPIVINQDNRLIAGERRLAAATSLGWTHIDVVYKETLTVDELHELELEENIRRKSMHWTEECLGIAKIHTLKVQRDALIGKEWGQKQTSELFGVSVGNVNYCLVVARRLKADLLLPEDKRLSWKFDSIASCWKELILKEEQDRIEAELAKRAQEEANNKKQVTQELVDTFTKELDAVEVVGENKDRVLELRQKAKGNYLNLTIDEAKELYDSSPLNDPEKFTEYYEHKRAMMREHFKVKLTDILLLGDSIEYMNANPSRFDHIITDIPYAIDMENLEQSNTGIDTSAVAVEHDVEANLDLMKKFFESAFACTKNNAFLVTWMDQMLWQYMYDLAIAAGWRVQRWPITWIKSHTCMNQSAQYNFTKTTEIAMVCRKPSATLARGATGCVVQASNEQAKKDFDHVFAKPFECWKFIIEHVSIEGQLVLEPFCGRGSGVVALLQTNRKVVGVEINQAHYNALLNNVQRHYLSLNPNFIFT